MTRFREWLIPELLREPDTLRRSKIYEAAADWRPLRSIRMGALCVFLLSLRLTRHMRSGLDLLLTFGGACLIAGVLIFVPLYFLRPQFRLRARIALSEQGVPICVPCGYDLTGNASGTCPECGASAAKGHSLAS